MARAYLRVYFDKAVGREARLKAAQWIWAQPGVGEVHYDAQCHRVDLTSVNAGATANALSQCQGLIIQTSPRRP